MDIECWCCGIELNDDMPYGCVWGWDDKSNHQVIVGFAHLECMEEGDLPVAHVEEET